MPLAIVIHSDAGVGKSRLADTVPGPRLILDAEGGTEWTPSPKVYWDPTQPIPTAMPDGSPITTDTSVVVMVREFSTLQIVLQWLQSGNHYFESVVMDSLTEIQKRCKDAVKGGNEYMTEQLWGRLLDGMELLVRQFRDLKFPGVRKPVNVVITALSNVKEIGGVSKNRPDVQGALARQLSSYPDVVGYLFVDTDAEGKPVRRLLIQPIGIHDAKDRTDTLTQRFGATIDRPDLATIIAVLKGEA